MGQGIGAAVLPVSLMAATSIGIAACSWDVYSEPLQGPIKLGGRTSITLPRALKTPGLRRYLCFQLPANYELDLHRRLVLAPNGDRGTLSARLKTDSGTWYSLTEFMQLGMGNSKNVCLLSTSLAGRMTLSFVEIEVNSGLAWESPGGHWASAEKL